MDQIIQFWKRHDYKILVILGFILVSVVSFNAGRTYENNIQPTEIKLSLNQSPLMAPNPKQERIVALGEALERNPEAKDLTSPIIAGESTTGTNAGLNQECAFVGSKNSDKYHLPSCSNATRIKQENLVCFSSKEDAESRGYVPAKDCIK